MVMHDGNHHYLNMVETSLVFAMKPTLTWHNYHQELMELMVIQFNIKPVNLLLVRMDNASDQISFL